MEIMIVFIDFNSKFEVGTNSEMFEVNKQLLDLTVTDRLYRNRVKDK